MSWNIDEINPRNKGRDINPEAKSIVLSSWLQGKIKLMVDWLTVRSDDLYKLLQYKQRFGGDLVESISHSRYDRRRQNGHVSVERRGLMCH